FSAILILFEKQRIYKELLTSVPALDMRFQKTLNKPVDSRYDYTSLPRMPWLDERLLEVLTIQVAFCEIVHFEISVQQNELTYSLCHSLDIYCLQRAFQIHQFHSLPVEHEHTQQFLSLSKPPQARRH